MSTRVRRSRASIRSRTAIGWKRSFRGRGVRSISRMTTSSGRPSRGTRRPSRTWFRGFTTPATFTRACTRGGTASGVKHSSPRKSSSTGAVRSIRRRSRSGSKRRTISSGCRSTRQPLLEHFQKNPDFSEPDTRRNEQLRLLESGLDDISISRAGQAWGIPLPWDPNSVVYVWFDALINYAAAVGLGTDPDRLNTGGRPIFT